MKGGVNIGIFINALNCELICVSSEYAHVSGDGKWICMGGQEMNWCISLEVTRNPFSTRETSCGGKELSEGISNKGSLGVYWIVVLIWKDNGW